MECFWHFAFLTCAIRLLDIHTTQENKKRGSITWYHKLAEYLGVDKVGCQAHNNAFIRLL